MSGSGGWLGDFRPGTRTAAAVSLPVSRLVRRAHEPNRGVCYKARLQDQLPVIRVPLRPGDADVRLDLQKLIDDAWQDGGYYSLRHTQGPLPPFDDADTDWVRERLRD
jgi:hypothetical protein